jgi:hypothetical protein
LKDETRRRREQLISEGRKKGKEGEEKEIKVADKEDYRFSRFMSKPFYMWNIVC